MTCLGLLVAAAILVMDIDEVLDARIALGGAAASI